MTHTACVLIIGNEILTGRTQDANLPYIGQKMMAAGIKLIHARVVPDVESEIIAQVNEVRAKYDYIFTTGGIGPTHDDITAACIAKAFGVALELSAEARNRLLRHYGTEADLTPARLRMAMIPAGATLIDNPISAAPGFQVENVFVLAGVPRIAQAMIDGLVGRLHGGLPILSVSISCLVPESVLAEGMTKIAAAFPEVDIGSYPYYRPGGFGVSLVARGTDSEELELVMAKLADLIQAHGGDPIRAA